MFEIQALNVKSNIFRIFEHPFSKPYKNNQHCISLQRKNPNLENLRNFAIKTRKQLASTVHLPFSQPEIHKIKKKYT